MLPFTKIEKQILRTVISSTLSIEQNKVIVLRAVFITIFSTGKVLPSLFNDVVSYHYK